MKVYILLIALVRLLSPVHEAYPSADFLARVAVSHRVLSGAEILEGKGVCTHEGMRAIEHQELSTTGFKTTRVLCYPQ